MIRRRRASNPMDDCLVLLQHAARYPDKRQTYQSLERDTGIAHSQIHQFVAEARADAFHSMLSRTACKYRFDFDVHEPRTGKIISAVFRWYG